MRRRSHAPPRRDRAPALALLAVSGGAAGAQTFGALSQVLLFRNAVGSAGGLHVVVEGRLTLAGHLEQVGPDRIDAMVSRPRRVRPAVQAIPRSSEGGKSHEAQPLSGLPSPRSCSRRGRSPVARACSARRLSRSR